MSIFSNFYLNESGDFIPNNLCHCFGGGDGGAADRAERDRQERLAKEKRIRENIELINVLFKNDPEARASQRLEVNKQISELDKLDPERFKLEQQLQGFNRVDALLTGPSQKEREASTISNVQDFFFDDLNEQRGDAVQQGSFELSRRGGLGGSQELDFLTNLQKKEDRARLDIGNTALDAKNNLIQQDAALKANLINQANQDFSTDILTSDFVNNLGQGLEQAQDTGRLTQFDPFFQFAGNLFSENALIRGDELGRGRADKALSFFSANPSRSSGSIGRT